MHAFLISLRHAFRGIGAALANERNFRIQIVAAVLVAVGGIFLGFSPVEWLFVTLAITLVLGIELMNTALEHILDFLSPGHSEEVKFAKDVMAAAVLVAASGATIIGVVIVTYHFGL